MPSLSKPGIVHPIQQTTGVLVQKIRVDYVSFHTRVFVIATQSIVFEGHLGNLRRQGVEQARTHSRRESAAVSSRSSSKGICGEISNIRWFQEKKRTSEGVATRLFLHATHILKISHIRFCCVPNVMGFTRRADKKTDAVVLETPNNRQKRRSVK